MLRIVIAAAAVISLSGATTVDEQPAATSSPTPLERLLSIVDEQATVVADKCCKRCRKGKACGDSCISSQRTCTKGQGCACND